MRKHNPVSRFMDRYFSEDLDLHVQIFNLLGCAGMAAGLAVAVVSAAQKAGALTVCVNLLASLLAFVLMRIAGKRISYRASIWIIVVSVFLCAFPALFFAIGGYRSGMPSFFMLAIIFTAILLDGPARVVTLVTEFVLYTACCVAAYLYPASVPLFEKEVYYLSDVITGFVVSGILLLLVILIHVRIYNNRQKRLMALDQLKAEFLGNMSHELRTPLTSVSGFAKHSFGILSDSAPPESRDIDEIRDNLRLVVLEADRMKRIVEQLLDIAAIEQSSFVLNRRPLSIPELVEEISGIHFRAMNANGNRLCMDIANGLSAVHADRDRLMQVFINLLSNASRHTKGGDITIAARAANGWAAFTVSDSGEGIPHALQPQLFERYLGADIGRAHGTGLGLYICRRIVEAHGGDIHIDSAPGAGTNVHFTLPLE